MNRKSSKSNTSTILDYPELDVCNLNYCPPKKNKPNLALRPEDDVEIV